MTIQAADYDVFCHRTTLHARAIGSVFPAGACLSVLIGLLALAFCAVLTPSAHAKTQFEHPVVLAASAFGDDKTSRIVLDFDREVEVSTQMLDHPWRLVLDFDRIGFGFAPKPDDWTGIASQIRWGDMSAYNSRMIFQMEKPFRISALAQSKNEVTDTYRIVIDLEVVDLEVFNTALLDMMKTSAVVQQSTKADRLGRQAKSGSENDVFTVVLDPGHGGIDSGAVGQKRTLEKDITLAFANKLRQKLEAYDGMKVLLTRETDVFVPLNDRVRFARQSGASLFISIHADSVKERYVRGATVYTISERASDSVAAQLAQRENAADEIAGIDYDESLDDVSDILVDLARRETLGFSVQFARLAVQSISEELQMIRNPHRYAGFRVLKAPDVPSVLVELGFLSNAQDEILLTNPDWRWTAATQLAKAIENFAKLSGHHNVVLKVDAE